MLFIFGTSRLGRYVRNADRMGEGIRLKRVYDSATIICAKKKIYIYHIHSRDAARS